MAALAMDAVHKLATAAGADLDTTVSTVDSDDDDDDDDDDEGSE